MTPLAQPSVEMQTQIRQECRPDLPFDRAGAAPEKVGQLQGLFEFFEKDFDLPAAAIQIDNGLRPPGEIVAQKNHLPHFPVHFH